MSQASELLELMPKLTPEERLELDSLLTAGLPIWVPQPGPQQRPVALGSDLL